MGSLKRFNLSRIISEYRTEYLFETGTWKGDSVKYASQFGFKKIFSSEIVKEIADTAGKRFQNQTHIEIINDNSIDALRKKVLDMKGNCLFWLDAHFPGAEEGLSPYNEVKEEVIKLPLEKEMELIGSRSPQYSDVILIDDLRIYEDGPFQSGNMPEHILGPQVRNINFIERYFGHSHLILKSYVNEGYVLVLPKTRLKKSVLRSLWYAIYNRLRHKIY